MTVGTISERLAAFIAEWLDRGVPDEVRHEAQRLLLNQLKASLGAIDDPGVRILHDWATRPDGAGSAHVLWLGTKTGPGEAALVNGALFEVLDFNDTYIPTFLHATSAVLPAALAQAEALGRTGRELVTALALGIEVELACATLLMPTGYSRGFIPGGLVGGIGAAVACGILARLDPVRLRNALGIAMCTAFGVYEAVGSMTLPYIVGATARSGLAAAQLAERGLTAPVTAFEGEKGMYVSHSNEPKEKLADPFATLGKQWRIRGQSYKTMPTETITHSPVECILQARRRARGRNVDRMTFQVEPIVAKIANERFERFGTPSSELEARFDLRYCAAAAWQRERFTLAEMREAAYRDPDILALRSRIDLIADPERKAFDWGAKLEVRFTDGSSERTVVDAFRGSAASPLSDAELGQLFVQTAEGILSPSTARRIADAVWALEREPQVPSFVALLRRAG